MSLLRQYTALLNHLGSTCHARELHHKPTQNLIGLRHDVDHDIDVALEMAWVENSLGFKSTYYLLSGTKYWSGSDFLSKAQQIHNFGHEIGLHLNTLAQWYKGETASAYDKLQEDLDYLRSTGITVTGIASHGDKACYKGGFVNHWIFKDYDLIPDGLSSISAEGIFVEDIKYQIKHPQNKFITRDDNRQENIQESSASAYGLDYLASALECKYYFSDSGGDWIRTPNPLQFDLSQTRAQILVHPIHWVDTSRKMFVLCPARSGSKYMTSVFDKTTSFRGIHEKTLNITRSEKGWESDKITTLSWASYQNNKKQLTNRLKESYAWYSEQSEDLIEFNVYLSDVIDEFKDIFPNQITIGLVRHPFSILRSILNRDWYLTEKDNKHLLLSSSADIDTRSQLNRCIAYIQKTFDVIENNAITIIRLEDIVDDPNNLKNYISPLSIAFYPDFITDDLLKARDQTHEFKIPELSEWPQDIRDHAISQLQNICKKYGYKTDIESDSDANYAYRINDKKIKQKADYAFAKKVTFTKGRNLKIDIYKDKFVEQLAADKFHMCFDRHSALFISGITSNESDNNNIDLLEWNLCRPEIDFPCEYLALYEFSYQSKNRDGKFTVIILMYDETLKLCDKKSIVSLNDESDEFNVNFRVPAYARYFRIALYSSKGKANNILDFNQCRVLLKIKLPRTSWLDIPILQRLFGGI